MDEKTDTRDIILKAAGNRILHYGYGKTTMVEIAADCGMSAGNIYRFFPAKVDIAEAIARRFNAESQQAYAAVARDSSLSAMERLKELFFQRLRRTFGLFDRHPKMMEVASVLHRERPDFFKEERDQERSTIAGVLKDGVAAGEFAPIADLSFFADLVQCAAMKFRYPQLWTTDALDVLEPELEGLMGLLLNGLTARV